MKDLNKSKIPIIIVSGNTGDEFTKECLNAGVNGILSKPINFDELLKQITIHSTKE